MAQPIISIPTIPIGSCSISRFIIGGNPFSGFSHVSRECDREMLCYYTTACIKETLRNAEKLGINMLCARADQHIIRLLMEYRDEGGTIQWLAQTCPEMTSIARSAEDAMKNGAQGCYIHGGVMDFLYAHNRLGEVFPVVEAIKREGIAAGIAGHNPCVFEWAEKNLDADFYMCCYYDASKRDKGTELSGRPEFFRAEDRNKMVTLIKRFSKPVIHYKILAAGRNDPREAFSFAVNHMRSTDAVCVGVYTKDNPKMLEEDVRLFLENIERVQK
jgi:hypothetical protein